MPEPSVRATVAVYSPEANTIVDQEVLSVEHMTLATPLTASVTVAFTASAVVLYTVPFTAVVVIVWLVNEGASLS